MPDYIVTGTDARGKARSQRVGAINEQVAMALVDFTAANVKRADREDAASVTPAPVPKRPTLEYSTFPGLNFVATTLRVIGILILVGGLVGIAAGIMGAIVMRDSTVALLAVWSLPALLWSIIIYAIGEACMALRVIAINSYLKG